MNLWMDLHLNNRGHSLKLVSGSCVSYNGCVKVGFHRALDKVRVRVRVRARIQCKGTGKGTGKGEGKAKSKGTARDRALEVDAHLGALAARLQRGRVPARVLDQCVPVFGIRVWDLGFRFRVSGFGLWGLGFGFMVSGFGFRVSGLGCRVHGLGVRVGGSGFRSSRAPLGGQAFEVDALFEAFAARLERSGRLGGVRRS